MCICICFFAGIGCSFSKEAKVEKGLEKKYNEKFIIHEIDGNKYDVEAIVSPKSNPQLVFKAKFLPDWSVESDGYYHAYIAQLMEKKLQEDLKCFFPNSYIRMDKVSMRWGENNLQDFRTMSIEEIMDNSVVYDGPYAGCFLSIYYCKDTESKSDIKGEYNYFTNMIDKYVEEKKMLPLTVTLYQVKPESISRLKDYFSKDLDEDSFYEEALGVDHFELGICGEGEQNVGNPPNISACFDKRAERYIGDYYEYERRRKELENE